MKKLLATIAIAACAHAQASDWVKATSQDGSIIVDGWGRVYQVDFKDQFDAAMWLPMDKIIIKDDRIFNVRECESVEIQPIFGF